MAVNIERLLRMVADYDNFCSGDYAKAGTADPDELSVEELDFVVAAAGMPQNDFKKDEEDQLH